MNVSSPAGAIDTSIVIATCSRAQLLRGALESLMVEAAGAALPVEIIVVDDGSTDETSEVLREMQRASPVPFTVLAGESLGVAAARNLGSQHARGKWIASFDDDQVAAPGWLAELRVLAEETGAACVGGSLQLRLPAGATLARFGPRARKVLGEHRPFVSAKVYDGGELPATNNALIRRDVFVETDGYDTTFTEGGEDTDFFLRVRVRGHALWFQPAASAWHVQPSERLSVGNLRWTSLRIGAGMARLYARRTWIVPAEWVVIRLALAAVRDLPLLGLAMARRDERLKLESLCSLWYTEGLLRALPALMLSCDSEFLKSLNFRVRNGERAAG